MVTESISQRFQTPQKRNTKTQRPSPRLADRGGSRRRLGDGQRDRWCLKWIGHDGILCPFGTTILSNAPTGSNTQRRLSRSPRGLVVGFLARVLLHLKAGSGVCRLPASFSGSEFGFATAGLGCQTGYQQMIQMEAYLVTHANRATYQSSSIAIMVDGLLDQSNIGMIRIPAEPECSVSGQAS